jgi:hypothetical protein
MLSFNENEGVETPPSEAFSREGITMRKSLLVLSSVLFVCAFAGAAQAQTSYPLLCRGGPAMRIMTAHDVDGRGIPGATAMYIYFNAGAGAGSLVPPGPGQCTWMDRTLNPDEPKVMWVKSPNIEFAFQVMGNGQVVSDATGPRLNVEGSAWSGEARDWDSVVRGVMTGQLFTVQVYNSGGASPVMVITRFGP